MDASKRQPGGIRPTLPILCVELASRDPVVNALDSDPALSRCGRREARRTQPGRVEPKRACSNNDGKFDMHMIAAALMAATRITSLAGRLPLRGRRLRSVATTTFEQIVILHRRNGEASFLVELDGSLP